jgi:hypothetical protein
LHPNLVAGPGIENRIQFEQDDFNHLLVRIEKPKPADAILRLQQEIVLKIFGPEMKVSYEFVDQIPLLKSGKYAFVICSIPKDKLKDLK